MIKKIFLFLALCCSSLSLFSSIYITGQNSEGFPCLWITDNQGNKIKTTVLDTTAGKGKALIIFNNQIYIVGQAADKPYLWITDLFGTTPKRISLAEEIGKSKQLIAYQNSLYIAGNLNGQATLWIVDLSNFSILTKSIGEGAVANNLLINKNKVYITGYTLESISNITASLWITDLNGNMKDTIYLAGIGSIPSGISQSGSFIYTLSAKGYPPNRGFYLTKLDLSGAIVEKVLFEPLTLDSLSFNMMSANASNFLLTDKGLFTTPVSQINVTPYYQPVITPPSTQFLFFSMLNSRYYIAGTDELTRASLFIFDRTGNLLGQQALDSEGSAAAGVATFSSFPSLFNFSPIKYQKGSN